VVFFITFEGIEGSGKSTQIEMLAKYLLAEGRDVLALREPGGTVLGERVRELLLNSQSEQLNPWAELFLYEACRAQLVADVIRPALDKGKIVICDRFIDSTLAYQGGGRGLGKDVVGGINKAATQSLVPDRTILIDLPVQLGLKRAFKRIDSMDDDAPKEDRFEREALEFHESVRETYLELSEAEPERIKLVDGAREVEVIHEEICGIIKDALS
jgi:dTMP kinase